MAWEEQTDLMSVREQIPMKPAAAAARHLSPAPFGTLQRKCACGGSAASGSECEECKKKETTLQRLSAGGAGPATAPPIVHEVLRSAGRPLDAATRSHFEPRLGHDFGNVRVHADGRAAESAEAVNARAYTVGQNIVFGSGQYAPGAPATQKLLAHELAHVIQQAGQNTAPAAQLKVGAVDSDDEREADGFAERLSRWDASIPGRDIPLNRRSAPGLRRNALLQRQALTCDVKPVQDECNDATAKCLTVADYCQKKFPTPADLDATVATGKAIIDSSGFGPNARANFKHWLDGSGSELVMASSLFESHQGTKTALMTQREKFMEGAKKRLEDGSLTPGGTADMRWTGAANAFIVSRHGTKAPPHSDDLAYAVGGYQLCSNVQVKATPLGGDRFKLEFKQWKAQAFDCYNWDPGKGIGIKGLEDKDLCCLENAGKAKHFLDRTDPWENTDADSREDAEITATVKAPPPAPAPAPASGVSVPAPAPPPAGKKSGT